MSEWSIETPIDNFEHPVTGSLIDVVSIAHVGQPSYYRTLGSYIMARQDEGFIVHYEGIDSSQAANPEVVSNPQGRLKSKLVALEEEMDIQGYVSIVSSSSYEIQPDSDGLFRSEGSFNYDVTSAEIAEQASIPAQLAMLYDAWRLRHGLGRAATRGRDAIDEYVFHLLKKGIDSLENSKKRINPSDKVMLDLRNEVALTGVDEALEVDPSAKLVLIWGMGHMVGLHAGVKARGYEQTGTQAVQLAFNWLGLKRDLHERYDTARRNRAKIRI